MLSASQLAAFEACFPVLLNDCDLREAIVTQAQWGKLSPGQTICEQGANCSSLALVTRGSARVYKLAESGREITLYRVEPGECCILTASCLLSHRTFPAHATVECDLEAAVIPQSRISAWMNCHEAWRHYLWNLLAERLGDVIGLVEEVAFRRMDERLAHYLQQRVREQGPVINATHQQIAAELGTSREVVSRMLKDFQLRGILDQRRGRIEMHDADRLEVF